MPENLDGVRPTARNANIVVQDAGGELLLYDLLTDRAFCLNENAAKIYYLCDGNNSIETIGNVLNIDSEDIIFAVRQFQEENLLENRTQTFSTKISNRREILKSTVNRSALALPLLTSIIAPKAIAASSSRACGVQTPPSSSPCPRIDCETTCDGGLYDIVIVNRCPACRCFCV